MDQKKDVCPSCGKGLPHPVLYRCISCSAKYCIKCEGSQSGIRCPKCGQYERKVLDQSK